MNQDQLAILEWSNLWDQVPQQQLENKNLMFKAKI